MSKELDEAVLNALGGKSNLQKIVEATQNEWRTYSKNTAICVCIDVEHKTYYLGMSGKSSWYSVGDHRGNVKRLLDHHRWACAGSIELAAEHYKDEEAHKKEYLIGTNPVQSEYSCAECSAAYQAVLAGASLRDLVFITVESTRFDGVWPLTKEPCPICKVWITALCIGYVVLNSMHTAYVIRYSEGGLAEISNDEKKKHAFRTVLEVIKSMNPENIKHKLTNV